MIYLDSNDSYVLTRMFISLEKDRCVYENRHSSKVQESLGCDSSHITSEDRIKALVFVYLGLPHSSHTATD